MRRIIVFSVAAACAIGLAACGGSSGSNAAKQPTATTSPPATSSTDHSYTKASADPSTSAKMICEPEAANDIATVLGEKTVKPFAPTWNDHVYSCDYVYKNGTMTMSVKEVSSDAETTAYFNEQAQKLGKKTELAGLGQGAFTTPSGDVVVRKDFKILTVDVSKLPAEFGAPPDTRENDAINVAATIMGCWTGA